MIHANHFRFFLTRAEPLVVFGTVESIISRIERVENRLDNDIAILFAQLGEEALKARIQPTDEAFWVENADSLANCRSAVSRYAEFRQWRAQQVAA